mmetsp:Transcript_2051/g.3897  ORF Transcript_2051/g.3897 Transcript_2051/m.3897 type:complete len:183 (+) Transcript_2051:564-1112(+)|eukprot:CAMPEP_0170169144 /NCGR_PEP_ID=MMETSP0040_2-20121228/2084_1 /TAXON_ID=641309 /ORGANISM="Lotharella oceanica, Strain CCMP622" /LENGTH=182 /DNA_ID=CAMNT_0010407735 /DNA_START=564 /DNA_END=1112 /DNA_ORIENTATION=-
MYIDDNPIVVNISGIPAKSLSARVVDVTPPDPNDNTSSGDTDDDERHQIMILGIVAFIVIVLLLPCVLMTCRQCRHSSRTWCSSHSCCDYGVPSNFGTFWTTDGQHLPDADSNILVSMGSVDNASIGGGSSQQHTRERDEHRITSVRALMGVAVTEQDRNNDDDLRPYNDDKQDDEIRWQRM